MAPASSYPDKGDLRDKLLTPLLPDLAPPVGSRLLSKASIVLLATAIELVHKCRCDREMSNFFEFEADFVDSLRCIPMQVRLKLDTCGVKLKLPDWHHLEAAERESLVELPCTTPAEVDAYRQYLKRAVLARSGAEPKDLAIEENPAWMDEDIVPDSVLEKAKECNLELTLDKWKSLAPVRRFALIKLSRSNHENHNFLPAAKEFNLL